MSRKTPPKPATPKMRCAIYTRKSTEEGLDQDFNTLDAQREAGEAFVASQQHEGWACVPDRYDDGGFTGGNMDRPALQRLMADIEAGKIDCVVVYKVDRLSRSLLDFARIIEVFDRRHVAFVSVTQQFNTSTSMGRLVLNVLLSFAQFEREIIGERIRDKIAAQRRRGKWTGGTPVLGYDVDRSGPSPKLVINATEAAQVRAIFDLYLAKGSLLPTVEELAKRNWLNKAWTTKSNRPKGGQPFDRGSLHSLITNPLYVGKLTHKKTLYSGEHQAIVSPEVYQQVQTLLLHNRRSGSSEARNRHGALLRGLLQCKACNHTMVHNFTGRGGKNYRYYTCTHAIKSGRKTCPSGSLPAAEIEAFVVDHIRSIANDKGMIAEVVAQARTFAEAEQTKMQSEHVDLERELVRYHADIRRLVADATSNEHALARVAELNCKISAAEQRLVEIKTELAKAEADYISDSALSDAFRQFDAMWNALSPRDRARAVALLVERVEYDASDSSITITFQSTGIKTLAHSPTVEAA